MIGVRIREERQRLGLSQAAFGEVGGVKKLTQITYEQGKRSPDARYLAALYRYGVDICYVISGERTHDFVTRLDKEIMLPVAKVALEWLRVTDREITAQLFADILTILYDGASQHFDEEYMADQLRAVK